jgi:hypothetical protein
VPALLLLLPAWHLLLLLLLHQLLARDALLLCLGLKA